MQSKRELQAKQKAEFSGALRIFGLHILLQVWNLENGIRNNVVERQGNK